jgi:hypothetical protein
MFVQIPAFGLTGYPVSDATLILVLNFLHIRHLTYTVL